jgi:O-antigen ligase
MGKLCAVMGFLLAFKSCLTYLFFRSDPQLGTAVRLAGTFAWLLVVVGCTVLDPPPRPEQGVPNKALPWIAMYLGVAGISLFWTVGDSLAIAAAYWIGLVADVVAVYLLLRYPPVEENARRMMCGFIIGAFFVAIIAWAAPPMDDLRLGNEDFLHPNLIGFYFAIGTLAAAYFAQRNKAWAWIAAALGITVVRTLSKATIIAFLLAGLYYLVNGLKITRKAKVWISVCSAFVLISFWGLMEAYFDVYSQGNNVETLTGRTYIWSQSFEFSMERPWFGHGFDSFRWIFPVFANFLPHHAHNELLQQFFAYGIVGLFIVIGIYWTFYRQVRVSRSSNLRSLAMAVLILVLVRGIVDTDQFDLGFPLWLITLFSTALSTAAMRRQDSAA